MKRMKTRTQEIKWTENHLNCGNFYLGRFDSIGWNSILPFKYDGLIKININNEEHSVGIECICNTLLVLNGKRHYSTTFSAQNKKKLEIRNTNPQLNLRRGHFYPHHKQTPIEEKKKKEKTC